MNRRNLTLSLLTTCAAVCFETRHAAAWTLITAEELAREKMTPQLAASPIEAQPGAPTIEVEQPDATKPIKSPVSVHIRFKPHEGATIVPESFRAKYGWLGIDVTDRITANAKIDPSGLVANNAEVPAGKYKLTLQIEDSLHRVGTRVLEFSVL